MASNYMTKGQFDRHMEQVHALEEKIAENAEYDAAREEVEFLTTRYEEMQAFLVGMQIVDPKRTDPGTVTIGKSVVLRDRATKEELVYNVVGGGWTDVARNEISFRAPLAAGLIGKKAGDRVELDVPGGKRSVEILRVGPYE